MEIENERLANGEDTSVIAVRAASGALPRFRYGVEPEEAWKIVVLNRWRKLCPRCFDQRTEMARVKYSMIDVAGTSWSDWPAPQRYGRKR